MQCMETRDALTLTFDFDPNAFDRVTIESLLSTWSDLIHRVANESNIGSTELSGANALSLIALVVACVMVCVCVCVWPSA